LLTRNFSLQLTREKALCVSFTNNVFANIRAFYLRTGSNWSRDSIQEFVVKLPKFWERDSVD